eukprot:gene6382-7647_t
MYGFHCACSRCGKGSSDPLEHLMEAAYCPHKPCNGLVSLRPPCPAAAEAAARVFSKCQTCRSRVKLPVGLSLSEEVRRHLQLLTAQDPVPLESVCDVASALVGGLELEGGVLHLPMATHVQPGWELMRNERLTPGETPASEPSSQKEGALGLHPFHMFEFQVAWDLLNVFINARRLDTRQGDVKRSGEGAD